MGGWRWVLCLSCNFHCWWYQCTAERTITAAARDEGRGSLPASDCIRGGAGMSDALRLCPASFSVCLSFLSLFFFMKKKKSVDWSVGLLRHRGVKW